MNMTNLHGSIGFSQLKKLNKIVKVKKKINLFYQSEIKKIKGLKITPTPKNTDSNLWLNILEIDPKVYGVNKINLMKKFIINKINVRSVWYPNHKQSFLKKYQSFQVSKAMKKYNHSICLPSGPGLKISELKKIINVLK